MTMMVMMIMMTLITILVMMVMNMMTMMTTMIATLRRPGSIQRTVGVIAEKDETQETQEARHPPFCLLGMITRTIKKRSWTFQQPSISR